MQVYRPGTDNDMPLLRWYGQLAADGDLTQLFSPSLQPLGNFMRRFIDPTLCLTYEEDDRGWIAVTWSSAFLGGADWNFWMRSDFRGKGKRTVMQFGEASRAVALERFPVLMSTTMHPELVPKIEQLGYKYVGMIPLIAEGANCHILYITREMVQPLDSTRWTA